MAPCRLYIATSKTSGKSYVGITVQSLAQRWSGHVHDAKRLSNCKFHRALNKYGAGDFEIVELFCYGSREDAASAEIELIAALDLCDTGYNISIGGDAPSLSRPASEERKRKVSAALSGKKKSLEHNRKVGDALRGKPKSAAHRAALSKAQTGLKRSAAHCAASARGHTGLRHTNEAKAKVSVARKAYWQRRREDEALFVYS